MLARMGFRQLQFAVGRALLGLRWVRAVLGFAALLVLAPCVASASASAAVDAEPVVVFAAASATAALSELADRYERQDGGPLRLSFASSATLARQILNGARPALFLSANRRWMDALDDAGLLAAGTRHAFIGNRLVMIQHMSSDRQVNLAAPASLLAALGDMPLLLGDPAHVPAGIYAREALKDLGLWNDLHGRLAYAANARAVTVRVARGEAPLGITYASELVGESRIKAAATIPPSAHAPIRYEIALIEPVHNPNALAFYERVLRPQAQAVLLKHGFTLASAPGSEGVPPSTRATMPLLRRRGERLRGRQAAPGSEGVPPSTKAKMPSLRCRGVALRGLRFASASTQLPRPMQR